MRLDDLIKPISPDAPCGEDLLALDDPDYCDYYFNVEDRFPTSYFNVVRGTLFDPKSVDQKAESTQIDALLARTRDLRLLGIEAKFQVLAGRFKGFADAVLGVAALLETYPDSVHPTDPVDRRNAIEELNALATIAAPLDYAILFTDRRIGDVIYRGYATASGKITARDGELPGDVGAINTALGSADNAKTVDALHDQLTALRAAIKQIVAQCRAAPQGFTPQLERLDEKLADIHAMVMQARGDLSATAAAVVPTDGDVAPAAPAEAATQVTVQTGTAEVPNHRAAYQLLQAVERYFASTEPASLALLLVTQSRLLIGRPLVEALDALLENSATYASISFGTETGFAISMSRMRDLSSQANIQTPEDFSQMAEGDREPPEVVSRDHAGQILKQIEDFFRIREPASPIPILLFKARNMLSKDFHALVRELIPQS